MSMIEPLKSSVKKDIKSHVGLTVILINVFLGIIVGWSYYHFGGFVPRAGASKLQTLAQQQLKISVQANTKS